MGPSVPPVRLASGTTTTADLAGQPGVDDVLALYVLLHVAQLLRGVVAVGAPQPRGTRVTENFRLNAGHNLGNVINYL